MILRVAHYLQCILVCHPEERSDEGSPESKKQEILRHYVPQDDKVVDDH